MKNKKILIVATRWSHPNYGVDGGAMTVKNIIDCMQIYADVDLLTYEDVTRSVNDEIVGNICTYDAISVQSDPNIDKFTYRMQASMTVAHRVKELLNRYDRIVVVHAWHALHFSDVFSVLDFEKMILLPMFLTPSYLFCGEKVPNEYINLEKRAVRMFKRIITPSEFESTQLKTSYGVEDSRIVIVPRYVDSIFKPIKHCLNSHKNINLISIASFKKQKRNHLAIGLCEELRKLGINPNMTLVGDIQDMSQYSLFTERLNKKSKNCNVKHLPYMSQIDISNEFAKSDFHLSFSSCETFGRAIRESLYSGLPNIILDDKGHMRNLLGSDNGVLLCSSLQEMAMKISSLMRTTELYTELSCQAIHYGANFDKNLIVGHLADSILF